jgi:hypothetical protein
MVRAILLGGTTALFALVDEHIHDPAKASAILLLFNQ